ncbi:tail fiber domain-containing protein [candidate division KSB1 bacterium]|nr:tail fiber domain-containing protein [candidate division KSB1 bacterium]
MKAQSRLVGWTVIFAVFLFSQAFGQLLVKNSSDIELMRVTQSGMVAIGTTDVSGRVVLTDPGDVFSFPGNADVPNSLNTGIIGYRASFDKMTSYDGYNQIIGMGVWMHANAPSGSGVFKVDGAIKGSLVSDVGGNTSAVAQGFLASNRAHPSSTRDVHGVFGSIDNPDKLFSRFPSDVLYLSAVTGAVDRNRNSSHPDKVFSLYCDGAKSYLEGPVGIGALDPGSYKLYVAGNAYTTGTWGSSDVRFKKEISPLENVLDHIDRLNGVSFKWRAGEFKDRGLNDRTQIGLIAQEVEQEFPELVSTDKEGYKAVAYDRLTAVLLQAVKELRSENQQLRSRLDAAGIK